MNDDELLDLVAEATTKAPVPDHLVQAAYRSRSWADIDAKLAELIEDSSDLAGAGVRSTDIERRLVFECDVGVVEITVPNDGTGLAVQADPAASVVVAYADGTETAPVGPAVAFDIDVPGPGSVRLILDTDQGIWRTGWFAI